MILCIKVLLLMFLFFFLSSFTGFLFVQKIKLEEKSGCLLLSGGAIINIILFAVLNSICALAGLKLPVAGIVWTILLIGIAFFVCIRFWKTFSDYIKTVVSNTVLILKNNRSWSLWLLSIIIILLTALQMFGTSLFGYHQPNATRQVWMATKAYETGNLSASSPMMMLWAWIAWIFKEHPLTIIFSVSQFLTLPLYYMGYTVLAGKLCRGKREQSLLLLLFLCILHLFGYQSGYALGMTLLFSYFSGGVFILQGVLPFFLFLLLTGLEKKHSLDLEKIQSGEDIAADTEEEWEDEDMKKHKIINARNIGIALVLFAVLVAGAIYILNNKINSLHNATQNLQIAMDEKCSIYEFKPEPSGEAEGYLLKQSDGRLVMIGGGTSENGEALYEFLTKYGAQLDKWYLYGKSEADMGAFDYCTGDREMEVGSVYYLTGMEEVK